MTLPSCQARKLPRIILYLTLFIASLSLANGQTATADQLPPSNAEILKELKTLQAKVSTLEQRLARYEGKETHEVSVHEKLQINPYPDSNLSTAANSNTQPGAQGRSGAVTGQSLFGLGYRSHAILSIGAYGELKFGGQDAPGRWKDGFDVGRIVLLPTLQVTDSITFNAELEFEHGGIAEDNDDKLTGSVDVEQAYIDFKFNDYINWRAPGVDVVPFGFINLFHEPTQFYSVQRPELYNGLIPSTWFEGSTSLYGKIVDDLNYQFQINTGLEDVGSKEGLPDDGSPYEGGITGNEALGLSRTPVGDFHQTKNAPGFALRLSYTPPFIPGLAGSSSVFYTPNITPRGAYGDSGRSLGHDSVTMLDTELRYRMPGTGLELRGEVADALIGSPGNLRANNDGHPENNVGKHLWGFSLEAAYHIDLSKSLRHGWEVVPFYRYTYQNLQTGGFDGDDLNLPTGQGQQQFHTLGVAVFPTPQVVLKLDYQFVFDNSPNSPQADHLLGAIGFFF
ncbi:MAG: autotransporter domain-containing protein [Chthoniobacterales bacterium]|nr:autotransporter domain-containing protein [Chthoniobacterales bacterium]